MQEKERKAGPERPLAILAKRTYGRVLHSKCVRTKKRISGESYMLQNKQYRTRKKRTKSRKRTRSSIIVKDAILSIKQ